MNEEINCISNKGKMAKNEWGDDVSDFLRALYTVLIECLYTVLIKLVNSFSILTR